MPDPEAPKANQSLYRKWRPQTFDSLKGQDVIRTTLHYALTHGQMSQAYLFCGPRGTGKTTTARLVAKLINCTSDGAKPCNTCQNCVTITEGSNLDVMELDAASNRGIDEIRQLRETVRFAPTQAKYKVFIIDEVHMLTREAFNALLKTLEEPPSHAVFILATTEAHKIPPTIISRCQRYDFRPADLEILTDHLLAVAETERMKLDRGAAAFIARLGDGSFRDALSLLDQARAANVPHYTLAAVETLFGYIPRDMMAQTLEAILKGDVTTSHQLIDDALAHGAHLRAFCEQLLQESQQALEASILGNVSDLPPILHDAVSKTSMAQFVTWIDLLADALVQTKQSPLPRLPLDLAITKYALKIDTSPKAVATPAPAVPLVVTHQSPVVSLPKVEVTAVGPEPAPSAPTPPQPVVETVAVPVAVAIPASLTPEEWRDVLQHVKTDAPSLLTSLSHARMQGMESDTLKLAVAYKMHAEKINQPKNRAKIEESLQAVLSIPLKVEAVVVKDLPPLEDEEVVDVSQVFELE